MWPVACIFYELVNGRILFDGESEIAQLFKIFQTLGTPTRASWPELISCSHFSSVWPQCAGNLDEVAANFDAQGRRLFLAMLRVDPKQRISAWDALNHEYFNDIKY